MSACQQSTMHPASYQVLAVLYETAQYHKKHYCYPNQATILRSLKLQFGRVISRRTLNRYLGWLEHNRFINRKRRHTRDKHGSLSLHSTLYTFTRKSGRFMCQLFDRVRYVVDKYAVSKMAQNNNPMIGSQPLTRPVSPSGCPSNVDKHLKAIMKRLKPT